MKILLPCAYFPPVSYFAWLLNNTVVIESKEHFVKQSLRSRCTILGANGSLNLLVPKAKSNTRQAMDEVRTHEETDWRTLHWRSLEAAYRNSPYFEYYEDRIKPFFEKKGTETGLLVLNMATTELITDLMQIPFQPTFTTEFEMDREELDLRNVWNKQQYAVSAPVADFPTYIQVFSDRHAFVPDLSILDLLFCLGPNSVDYLRALKLNHTNH